MPSNSFQGDLRGHHCFYAITNRATMAAEIVQQLLEFWVVFSHFCEQSNMTEGLLPALIEHLQQDTTGTGSACVLQIKTIQMQALGITSWRILSNRLCFHALFIHIYISLKMASFE